MTAPKTPSYRSSIMRLLALVAAGLLALTACTETATIPAEVSDQLDGSGSIADLTEAGQEDVPRVDLLRATSRARELGTELHIVIAGVDDELVSASAIVARYGGTALSYKANETRFEAASDDIHSDIIDRAIIPAGQSENLGASALAFVSVLEEEGLRAPDRVWWPIVAAVLLALSLAFLAYQVFRFAKSRKATAKRRRAFEERRIVLRDWAGRLAPEIATTEAAIPSVGEAGRQTLSEARDLSNRIVTKIDEATTLGDLDAAEMRLGRTYIKLRDLRAEHDRNQ